MCSITFLCRAPLAYQCSHSSCVCTRAQHHSLSSMMSLHAASRAGAACVCALALPTYAHWEARYTARALRTTQKRYSRACQPFPLFRPGQNRSGGTLEGDQEIVKPWQDPGHSALGADFALGSIAQGASQRPQAPLPTLE